MGLFSFLTRLFGKKTLKVGLALGSGGAKGAALIGALKALKEEGVNFDFVAGTSIGSIVGALYALDYDTDEMIRIWETYDLTNRINLLKMTFKKDSLENTLEEIFGDKTFQDTLIPFRAIATDVNTGEEVVMCTGKLSKALAASAAIPPVFKPVHRNGRKLVDGAFVNAVPCDVVKNLGADVVVSIALHDHASNDGIKKYLDIFYRGNGIKKGDRLWQLEYSDCKISPDLSKFTTADVKSFGKMYEIGYDAVKNNIASIKKTVCGKKSKRKLS